MCACAICLQSSQLPLGLAPAVAARARLATGSDVNAAEFSSRDAQSLRRQRYIKAQVLLDRAGFSPGAIDGRDGDNFANALRALPAAATRSPTAASSIRPTWDEADAQGARARVLIEYAITADDVKGPFAEEIPGKLREEGEAQAARLHQRGRDAGRALPHGRGRFSRTLNREKDFDKTGTAIVVANVNVKPVALSDRSAKHRSRTKATTCVRCAREGWHARRLLSGLDRQRGEAGAVRHAEGRARREESDLHLRSRVPSSRA